MDRYLAELKAEADSLYENTEVYGIADYIITYNNGIVTCPVLFLQQTVRLPHLPCTLRISSGRFPALIRANI